MNLNQPLIAELQQEAVVTRKCLERLPASEFGWKPHEKSMTLGTLATHIAEMTNWLPISVYQDQLDFAAADFPPTVIESTDELLVLFDRNLEAGIAALEAATDDKMGQPWSLRNGEEVYFTAPKAEVIRGMVLNHIVHHRGQLVVYMRLKDIPVPALYGPSADEQAF